MFLVTNRCYIFSRLLHVLVLSYLANILIVNIGGVKGLQVADILILTDPFSSISETATTCRLELNYHTKNMKLNEVKQQEESTMLSPQEMDALDFIVTSKEKQKNNINIDNNIDTDLMSSTSTIHSDSDSDSDSVYSLQSSALADFAHNFFKLY